MSRLDKQLDAISGEQVVKIIWPAGAEVDTRQLRSQLIREIDLHRERIPLDLREVDGAPHDLVELIHDLRRYALSKSKTLSTSRILPPLRKALEKRARKPLGKSVSESSKASEQTSDVVNQLLKENEQKKEYDLSKAEKVERKRKAKTADRYRYWKLAGLILFATLIIAAVETYYVLVIDVESPVIPTEKTHEQD